MVGVGIIQNWCRNSKFLLQSHRIALSHVMPNTRSQLLYANASGQPFFQIWLPSLLQGILGPFNYPAPDRPFYRRATSSAKHPNFLRLSLKTDKLASLGPFFVERSAIPCEGIVVNFLFWQECSKGLLCCLCRELGWASEWVCPDVPLVAISRTDFFVTEEWLQMAHTLDVRIIMVTAGPALQKHDGYQYILPAGVRELHRTASSPTHVEWGSVFSMAEGTGNSSPSASSPTHLDWFLTNWYLES